ncbi:MAG TPA: ion transporter [Burkholderiaceae bacterium]|nr:ion transporter [Burkholderiaceae bacterium]
MSDSRGIAVRGWRARLAAQLERPATQRGIIALILANAAILGLETSPAVMARWGETLLVLDQAILTIFVVEIALRIVAHGPRFFRDPWSLFDFAVVAIALVPAAGPFSVLRALRVLRVLRLMTMLPSMRRVVAGLLSAVPGLISVFGVLLIIFYVGAVISTKLFGEQFPQWFGHLGASAYTLFQVMTLESWSMGIVRPVMEEFPYAWMFFIVFILVSTFTMLNLFIAVIVNAIQSEATRDAIGAAPEDPTVAELRRLREEVASLRDLLTRGDGRGGARAASLPPQNAQR